MGRIATARAVRVCCSPPPPATPPENVIMLKFSSKPIAEHAEVPLADDGRWEELVAHWSSRNVGREAPKTEAGSDVYVVSVSTERERDPRALEAQLAEIVSLAENQGDRVVGRESCHLPRPHPRTLLGKGKAEQIAAHARASGATMLVLDAELTPSQLRNLEDALLMPVCDREAVILNVFLKHARTRRARIQVELAQLEYLKPRIRGVGINMDQQAAGMGNARGPGETASELLVRKFETRSAELSRALRKIATSSRTQRQGRDTCKRAVLVGYTNAGKTSLMNALSKADLSARDMPFETLDATSRCLTRHGGDVLLSDTVGFIRRLPERLLASFESTLAEIVDASLLLLVVDATDHERMEKLETTLALLEKLGAAHVPRFYVWNKADQLSNRDDGLNDGPLARMSQEHPWLLVSSHNAADMVGLRDKLLSAVRADEQSTTVLVPYGAGAVLSEIYRTARVLSSEATDGGLMVTLQGGAAVMARVRASLEEWTS